MNVVTNSIFASLNNSSPVHDYISLIIVSIWIISSVLVAIKVVMETSNSTKTAAYLLLIFFVPVIGIITYFTFGVNYRKNKLYQNKLLENHDLQDRIREWTIKETASNEQVYSDLIGDKHDLVTLLLHDAFSPLTNDNRLELLINGEGKFPKVFEELEKATNHIHIEYYIYDDDEIGNRLKELLVRKAKEGVKIRLIYDDFGSHGIRKKIAVELREAGAEVFPFYEIKFFFLANRYNYRNHRKTIVIDGKVGFIGGINVSDKYVNNGHQPLFWRDSHLMIQGEAVFSLQYLFISNWNFCSKRSLDLNRDFFPEVEKCESPTLVQIVGSGPDSDRPSIMLSFTAIATARERVYITSPYFIPSESILYSIKKAALSGVDVRVLVPGISDSRFVNFASRAYYGELLACGARVFFYKKGFIHAKTIVVDDNLSIIGTANVDFRSFDLNFEAIAVVYDQKLNEEMRTAFINDLHDSEEVLLEDWEKRSKFTQFAEATAKLVSPIL